MADAILADVESSGIYQIRNLVNGKRYIGSAVDFARRWRQHQCELLHGRHNPKLQRSWNKHGAEHFVFEVIERIADKAKLIEREQYYLDTCAPEYNVARIAGSNFGVKWSKETLMRMSEANRKVWQSEAHRKKMSEAHKGHVPTAAHRANMSRAQTGRKMTPAQCAAASERNRIIFGTPEQRARMSKRWKGVPKTAEQIEKMRAKKLGMPAHNKGVPQSEGQKAKQSEAMKAKYRDDPELRERVRQKTIEAMNRPEVLEKMQRFTASRIGTKQSEETKRKRSISLRASWARRKELKRA